MIKKYNWELWFVRGRTTIRRNVDYICSQSSMCQLIRNAASKHGVSIGLHDSGDTITIEVRGETARTHPTPVAPEHEPPTLAPIV